MRADLEDVVLGRLRDSPAQRADSSLLRRPAVPHTPRRMATRNPISGGLERRRARRATWAFNHALDTYARTLARIERPVGALGGHPSDPMPRRAAEAMPRLWREHAKFRSASVEIDEARDAVIRRLQDPKTPASAAAAARERFEPLVERHPTPDWLEQRAAAWTQTLERLETWANRDPDHAAAAAERRAARQLSRR
jgi:hypothetical protein